MCGIFPDHCQVNSKPEFGAHNVCGERLVMKKCLVEAMDSWEAPVRGSSMQHEESLPQSRCLCHRKPLESDGLCLKHLRTWWIWCFPTPFKSIIYILENPSLNMYYSVIYLIFTINAIITIRSDLFFKCLCWVGNGLYAQNYAMKPLQWPRYDWLGTGLRTVVLEKNPWYWGAEFSRSSLWENRFCAIY